MKIELIEWLDSSMIHGWQAPANIDTLPATCLTAGCVVYEDKKVVTVACSLSEDGHIAQTMIIPKTAIKKRKVIHRIK